MASQAEIQDLATDARYFQGLSERSLAAMQVFLLWQQANGGTMTKEDIQALADDSACLANCMTHKQLLAAQVQLLHAGAGGGGGGTGIIQVYTGAAPPAAPDDPTEAAIFYPTGGGAIQEWTNGAWV